MVEVYLGLGSNIGNRAGYLKSAVAGLKLLKSINILDVSSIYLTKPVGPIAQEAFLNAVVRIETSMSPMSLLNTVLRIERDCGRIRGEPWGPRTLDIDILLYGDLEIEEEALVVPHPLVMERAFALAPLAELCPELRIDKRLVISQLDRIGKIGIERLLNFDQSEIVGIIGASSKEDRFSYRAQKLLMALGHSVVPVSYRDDEILGVPCYRNVGDYPDRLDTMTLYLSPERQRSIIDNLVEAKPKRVIFNPGSESLESLKRFTTLNIPTQNDCTLVLLQTNQFS